MVTDIESVDFVLSALEQFQKANKFDKPDVIQSHMEQVLELPIVNTSIKFLLVSFWCKRNVAIDNKQPLW